MFLRCCSALHLSSTLVDATATDEHEWREHCQVPCPYEDIMKCKIFDWNSQGSIVDQHEGYVSRVLEAASWS
jgi:hypothetical protein